MACRVGMTTNPEERKQYWKSRHPDLWNWQILGHYEYKKDAQAAEIAIADKYGCISFPGGDGPEIADWIVYGFQYQSMSYEPVFSSGVVVKKIPLSTRRHTAFLLDEIASTGGVSYWFILRVMDNESQEPCLYVASEVRGLYGEEARNKRSAALVPPVGEQFVLGVFPGDGHISRDVSEDYGDLGKFEEAAIKIAEEFIHERFVNPFESD